MDHKSRKRQRMRRAAKAPEWVRHVAATKWHPKAQAKYRSRENTFGAASDVRIIVKDGSPVGDIHG